jgi:hypothetical protein
MKQRPRQNDPPPPPFPGRGEGLCRLADIAHARSGDKGNHANVAVLAYTASGFEWLKAHLTAERVAEYFAPLGASRVERFAADNLRAFNFLLYDALAGGASRSLRTDTQGKTLGLALLEMPIVVPTNKIETMLRQPRKASQ